LSRALARRAAAAENRAVLSGARPLREPEALCAVCGARFVAAGARPGARVACGLCGTPLVLGALCRDRRRYRARSPALPRARRLTRSEIRAFARRAILMIALSVLVAAAWHWREPIASWWRATRVSILRPDNGR
jgi:hypothetical protein